MHGPEVLIPIIALLSFAAMVIFWRKFTNDERMALIEKGGDANIFNRKSNSYPSLRYGLLFCGAGIGLLVASLLDNARIVEEEAAYFSMLFIFGGAGLFISFFMEKKMDDKENKKD